MIKDFRRADDQAIRFAGEDFGKDRVLYWPLYIVMIVIAFLYAVVVQYY